MTARLLEGRQLAERIRADVATRAASCATIRGRQATLVAVMVGDDPASLAYTRAKSRAADAVGIGFRLERIGGPAATAEIVEVVERLGADPAVDGILVELPLPQGIDRHAVQGAIDPAKDVDGASPENRSRLLAGIPGPRPATALAVMALLEAAAVPLAGCRATVIGRSLVVGRPAALMLLEANATVTVAHTRTRDLAAVGRGAEVLVAAAGVPGLVTADFVHPGATVIDVGTTVVATGSASRVVGDVAESARSVAAAVSPVPGGVGPVTTAILLRTVVELAERAAGAGERAVRVDAAGP